MAWSGKEIGPSYGPLRRRSVVRLAQLGDTIRQLAPGRPIHSREESNHLVPNIFHARSSFLPFLHSFPGSEYVAQQQIRNTNPILIDPVSVRIPAGCRRLCSGEHLPGSRPSEAQRTVMSYNPHQCDRDCRRRPTAFAPGGRAGSAGMPLGCSAVALARRGRGYVRIPAWTPCSYLPFHYHVERPGTSIDDPM